MGRDYARTECYLQKYYTILRKKIKNRSKHTRPKTKKYMFLPGIKVLKLKSFEPTFACGGG